MINFSSVPRRDPRNSEAPLNHYAIARSTGTIDLRSLAEKISDRCTLTTIDTFAVLEALVNQIPQELAEGKIVQLGDFGSYRVTLHSEGAATAEELTSLAIKDVKVNFRQGPTFRKKFSNLKFKKVS
jgi:predicted histone-like DNA-binding protein